MHRPIYRQQAVTDGRKRSRAHSGHSGKVIATQSCCTVLKSDAPFFPNSGEKHAHLNSTPRAVFGVPLEEALEVSQICNLPSIIFRSIQYLEAKKADQEEGIYRLSGSSAVIKSLKDRFNHGSCCSSLNITNPNPINCFF